MFNSGSQKKGRLFSESAFPVAGVPSLTAVFLEPSSFMESVGAIEIAGQGAHPRAYTAWSIVVAAS